MDCVHYILSKIQDVNGPIKNIYNNVQHFNKYYLPNAYIISWIFFWLNLILEKKILTNFLNFWLLNTLHEYRIYFKKFNFLLKN